MLPITFLEDSKLRLSQVAVGIFAVAILTAGFCFTGLLTFAVRNPLFQADSLFLPALTSSVLGLLTIFYDFLISTRYVWNIPAVLLVVAAAVASLVYGALFLHTHRRLARLRSRGKNIQRISQLHRTDTGTSSSAHLAPHARSLTSLGTASTGPERTLYQDPQYYDNYVRNMFPASAHAPSPPAEGYDPDCITEEEMQRQQMLMLLLQRPEHEPSPGPAAAAGGTYRIDWQGRDEEDAAPRHGFYAPQPQPMASVSRQWSGQGGLQPWDGVWRAPAPMQRGRGSVLAREEGGGRGRPVSPAERERRRRQIEMGQ